MTPPTGITRFQCNVCGAECQFPLDQLRRETASCNQCHSSPRIRALVDLLSRQLTGQSRTIAEFPTQKNIRGLGLTDPDSIASRLAKKFDYQNTYFHQPPRLDIKGDLDSSQLGSYDFVISSEVFEHVLPPVRTAFVNVFRLLKPGGLLALTVPYGIQQETIEHYPRLYDFKIEKDKTEFIVKNQTREGTTEIFENPVFHGGPGATLEMRIFCERDLLQHLEKIGFTGIEIYRPSTFRFGIWWPEPWSLPISARKPL
jgi:SAM-dependent methyltransferase